MTDPNLLPLLQSIADSLARLAPPAARANDLDVSEAFVWQAEGWLEPVETVSRVLRVLKDKGVIRVPSVDRIEVLDVDALRMLGD